MNKEIETKEYMEKLAGLKLSDSSRERIQKNLSEYAQFHTIPEGVRITEESRSIKQVQRSTSLLRLRFKYMPIAIIIALFVGGSVSYAAEGAVPGEILYGIKTEVNENIKVAFTFGAEAEARLQADLLDKRLAEAEELKSENKLSGEVGLRMQAEIEEQIQAASEAAAESDSSAKAILAAKIAATVQGYNSLVVDNNSLVIDLTNLDIDSDVSAALGTSLSTGTISIDTYIEDTDVRVKLLRSLLIKYQSDISTEIKTDLSAKLDTAASLVVEARSQSEAEARATLDDASELVGEVEAKLSTLGQVKVDAGIITDIDFSVDPLVDPIREVKVEVESGNTVDSDRSNSSVDADNSVDADVDTDLLNTSSSLNASSGLSL